MHICSPTSQMCHHIHDTNHLYLMSPSKFSSSRPLPRSWPPSSQCEPSQPRIALILTISITSSMWSCRLVAVNYPNSVISCFLLDVKVHDNQQWNSTTASKYFFIWFQWWSYDDDHDLMIQGPSEFSMTEDAVIADMDLSPQVRYFKIIIMDKIWSDTNLSH